MSLEEQVARHFEKKLKWSDIKELVREALELSENENGFVIRLIYNLINDNKILKEEIS